MKIKSINISKVFGEDDRVLKAEFNDDVTLLYGNNGCGKTTLLNILSVVLSGNIYELRNYQFSKIIVVYNSDDSKNKELIVDKSTENGNVIFNLGFNDEKLLINRCDEHDIYQYNDNHNLFFENYPLCQEIKDYFNIIYLPLNRYDNDFAEYDDEIFYNIGRRNYNRSSVEYLNDSIRKIQGIVRNYIINLNVKLSKVDDNFRKDVLKEMSTLEKNAPIDRIISEYKKNNEKDIDETKERYKQALKDNEIFDENKKNQIDDFIKEFKNKIEQAKQSRDGMEVSFAWMYFQYFKMQKIAEYSHNHDVEKDRITMKRNNFVSVINTYFRDKHLEITDNGKLKINKPNCSSDINPMNLSSGEKQLLISFVSLYFRFNEKENGICIIDEPESSLHIDWQRNFIKDLLQANNNVQYIFATHSPEIVGKYSAKLCKME